MIEFHDDEFILKRKGFKQIFNLKYNQLEKVKIEKITSRYSSGIRFLIFIDENSKIKNIPHFEIKKNRHAKELSAFLSKKNIKVVGNLKEYDL